MAFGVRTSTTVGNGKQRKRKSEAPLKISNSSPKLVALRSIFKLLESEDLWKALDHYGLESNFVNLIVYAI